MPSEETLQRIQAIKQKIEKVGEALGVPHDEAAALVVVDMIEQQAAKQEARQSATVRLWIWVKKVISFAHSEADKIRIE